MQSSLRNFLSHNFRSSQNLVRNVFGGITTNSDPRSDSVDGKPPPAITHLSESELFLKDTGNFFKIFIIFLVKKFSNDVVRPLVRKMDAVSTMDPSIIKGCFENGVSFY